jgi:hypothetical protein
MALDAGTLTLDSGGDGVVIKYEEDGFFKLTVPEIAKRFVQDRGKNTSTLINKPEEQPTFSFTCLLLDDQDTNTIHSTLDGTKNLTYAIDGGKTHTLYYVKGTVDVDPTEDGHKITVNGTAQGWSNATDTYGLTS